jgi:hypothetical protein
LMIALGIGGTSWVKRHKNNSFEWCQNVPLSFGFGNWVPQSITRGALAETTSPSSSTSVLPSATQSVIIILSQSLFSERQKLPSFCLSVVEFHWLVTKSYLITS